MNLPRATRNSCGAVLDVTGTFACVWVNGLTDDAGLDVDAATLPEWMPYKGRTFDLVYPADLEDDPRAAIAAGTFTRQRCDDDGDGPVDEGASWARMWEHCRRLAGSPALDGVL